MVVMRSTSKEWTSGNVFQRHSERRAMAVKSSMLSGIMTGKGTGNSIPADVDLPELFTSSEFGFDTHTAGALARLYDYIDHGEPLPVADAIRWSGCGVLDADADADTGTDINIPIAVANAHVHMPGPVDSALSWVLLGMLWDGKISMVAGLCLAQAPVSRMSRLSSLLPV
jgi:hypothetical protein